jgi:drug/metabolite transporter (DMT)-like permease
MTHQSTRAGILLTIAAVATFSVQDGFSRHLAGSYNTLMVVTVRYWFFAAFVLMLALRQKGGLRPMATRQPVLHFLRAAFLITEVCVIVQSYTMIGLVQTHAVFACCPLLIAALAGPLLGEKVPLARWIAIGCGFAGILVILQPGSGVFSLLALLPLLSALMYALYSLMTRKAAARDSSLVSLFWSGIIGAALMTPIGLFTWQPISGPDWGFMFFYGLMAVLANWLVIRAYELAEASALQPFAYLQLVFVSAIGVAVFDEDIRANVVVGAAIVVLAGLFTLVRSRGTRAVEAV